MAATATRAGTSTLEPRAEWGRGGVMTPERIGRICIPAIRPAPTAPEQQEHDSTPRPGALTWFAHVTFERCITHRPR